MRRLFWGWAMVFAWVTGMGAQRFQPGDTATLWYRDIGQSSGFYQGLFMVDTVTPNFYIFTEQRQVETGQVFGSFAKGFVGALVGTKPYFIANGAWYLDASYDENLSTPALTEMFGFGFSDRALIFGFGGNQLVKAPLTPTASWTDQVVLDEPIRTISMSPLNNTIRSRDAYLFVAWEHSLLEAFRGTLSQLKLTTPDLFVDDRFDASSPFQDAGVFTTDWVLSQGTASETDVIMGGKTYSGVLADAGAQFEKSFSLPLQEIPFVVDLRLGLASGDAFWFTLSNAGGALLGVGVENDTLKVDDGSQVRVLGALGLGALRTPVRLTFTVQDAGGNLELSYVASVSGAAVLSGTDTLGALSGFLGADRVRFDVSGGRLFVDGVTVAPSYVRVTGLAGATADILVLTRGGTLYRKDGSGWAVVAQGVPEARWFRVTLADPGVIWLVAKDGALYKSSDTGATWTQVGLPSGAAEARDVAPSFTAVDSVLLATDGGLFVSGDGGATWSDLTPQLAKFDPEPWVRDVKSVLWEGGPEALVSTGGSFFYTQSGLSALEEFDPGLEPTYVSSAQIQGLVQVLEDSSAFSSQGLWAAVQNLIGGLGSDVDNDPRIGVLLTDVSHQLTSDSRVPLFDVVDPELFDPASSHYNGMECIVLDVNYAGTLVDFTQPEDPSDVQVPHALDGVVRNLARLVVFTHRLDAERWVAEGLAELVLRTLRDGLGSLNAVDSSTLTFPALSGSYRLDVWPTVFNSPDEPWVLRRFLYVFLKDLAGSYGVDLGQLFTLDSPTGKDLIAQLAGESFDQVFLNFIRNITYAGLTLTPRLDLESFGTSYASRGSGNVEISNIIPYSFRIFKINNDVRFTNADSVVVDSFRVAPNAPDTLQAFLALYRQHGVGADSVVLDPSFSFEGTLVNDTVFRPGVALYDTTGSPTDAFVGDRLNLVVVRTSETGRPVTGLTITLDDFTPPQITYGFVQDPLSDTRAVFYLFADEPVYAEWANDNGALPLEGPLFTEVEQNEFGLFDTSVSHMSRATGTIYYGGIFYEKVADLLSDKKWITIQGEDRFGNAFPTIQDSMVLWTLRPGQSAVVSTGDVRLDVPAGALNREVRILVRTLDGQDPWVRLHTEDALQGVERAVQVGSASITFQAPVTLTLRLPDNLQEEGVRVFHRTEAGWVEVPVRRTRPDQVEITTDRLGLFALASGGQALPTSFAFALAQPVLKVRNSLRFQVAMPQAGQVRIGVFNALGQRVLTRTLTLQPGFHDLALDGRFAPGAYFVRVETQDRHQVDRFVVVP